MLYLPDFPSLFRHELRPNVQKGAAYLDEYHHGWAEKIMPADLSMSTTEMCVCGQLFGNFISRPGAVRPDAWRYGFDLPEEMKMLAMGLCRSPDLFLQMWRALDILWLDEVFWRMGREAA